MRLPREWSGQVSPNFLVKARSKRLQAYFHEPDSSALELCSFQRTAPMRPTTDEEDYSPCAVTAFQEKFWLRSCCWARSLWRKHFGRLRFPWLRMILISASGPRRMI